MAAIKRKIYNILCLSAFALVFASAIIWRKSASHGIYLGITYSISSLIPSIMPFMFLSSLFTECSCSEIVCRFFAPVMKFVFRLSPGSAPAVIFGLTCGYPVGAKLTSRLLETNKISADEAKRLTLFVLNPGIPFCVLFFGGVILSDMTKGLMVYLAIIISNIISGFILGLKAPKNKANAAFNHSSRTDFSLAAKSAMDSTVRACLNMSVYIIIFRGFIAILHDSGLFAYINRAVRLPFLTSTENAGILSFLLEVTTGMDDAIKLRLPLAIFAFGLAFGGICIHLQSFSFFRNKPCGFLEYFFIRLANGVLSVLILRLISFFYKPEVQVFSTIGTKIFGGIKGSFIGSVCLLMLFGAYILAGEKITVAKVSKK